MRDLENVCFYLDDIIVKDHLKNLETVLKRIDDFGFQVSHNKCQFMKDSVKYLGITISKNGISTILEKVEAVVQMPRPENLKKLESFKGKVNYYYKFIPDFSDICYLLNRLRRKGVTWDWNEECEQAFEKLKSSLASTPVLAHYNSELNLILAADSSSFGV